MLSDINRKSLRINKAFNTIIIYWITANKISISSLLVLYDSLFDLTIINISLSALLKFFAYNSAKFLFKYARFILIL
ncbi:hypothetical protein ES705_21298 [subsurface metagenome]